MKTFCIIDVTLTSQLLKILGNPPPTPSSHPPPQQREGMKTDPLKIAQKPTCQEFVRASEYTAELSLDIIDNPYSNRGSQIRRYTKQTYRPIDQDQGAERIEGGGYGTGGSHHGSITIGLSGR